MEAYNYINRSSIFIEASMRTSLKFVASCHLCRLLFLTCMLAKNFKHKVISSSDFVLSLLRDVRLGGHHLDNLIYSPVSKDATDAKPGRSPRGIFYAQIQTSLATFPNARQKKIRSIAQESKTTSNPQYCTGRAPERLTSGLGTFTCRTLDCENVQGI